MNPFEYPAEEHGRRHAPRGYAQPESFLPWLRDEFSFRCRYCLDREAWQTRVGRFVCDHFLPVCSHPHLQLRYENLIYACVSCNLQKGSQELASPESALLIHSVRVHSDGRIEGLTEEAQALIDKIALDSEDRRQFRRLWIEIIQVTAAHAPELHAELLGYPRDLPDLSQLRPPRGNERASGIEDSHYARRESGQLPATY